jgi:hypothetical protein
MPQRFPACRRVNDGADPAIKIRRIRQRAGLRISGGSGAQYPDSPNAPSPRGRMRKKLRPCGFNRD